MSDEERSIEDDLREAYAAHVQDDPAPEAPREPQAPEPESVEPTRERDEHGRFKAKEAAEPSEPIEAPADAPAEAPTEPQAAEPTPPNDDRPQPDPYGLPPQYSGAAVKEKWADLPPEVRKDIVEREKDVHRLATKFDEERVFGKQVREVVKPYENFIRQLGAEPVQAFDYLLKTDYALRTAAPDQRKSLFLKAAKDYGVDLSGTNDNAPGQQPSPVDPRFETLEQRLNRLETERNNAMVAARDEEQRTINSQIESFASRPENAYFERVKPIMATLLQTGQADSLEKAYEMAVYADPETRALHLAAQREAEDRKRAAEQAEKAKKARQASPSVTGAPGLTVPTTHANGSASLEDDIRSAMAAVTGRA